MITFVPPSPAEGATLTGDSVSFTFTYPKKPNQSKTLCLRPARARRPHSGPCDPTVVFGNGSLSGIAHGGLANGSYTLTVSLVSNGGGGRDLSHAALHGSPCRDEIQGVRVSNATGGTFTLTFDGQTTAPIGTSTPRPRQRVSTRGAQQRRARAATGRQAADVETCRRDSPASAHCRGDVVCHRVTADVDALTVHRSRPTLRSPRSAWRLAACRPQRWGDVVIFRVEPATMWAYAMKPADYQSRVALSVGSARAVRYGQLPAPLSVSYVVVFAISVTRSPSACSGASLSPNRCQSIGTETHGVRLGTWAEMSVGRLRGPIGLSMCRGDAEGGELLSVVLPCVPLGGAPVGADQLDEPRGSVLRNVHHGEHTRASI